MNILAQSATEVSATVTSKDGTIIAYEQLGSGPAIVLVGAALSDRGDPAKLAKLLAAKFTVINYDRRGRGNSADTPPYAVEREVEDIEALIDAAGGSAYLFGSSSGAVLALEAGSKLGAKVNGLFLYEPPFKGNFTADVAAETKNKIFLRGTMLPTLAPDPGSFKPIPHGIYTFRSIGTESGRVGVSKIEFVPPGG